MENKTENDVYASAAKKNDTAAAEIKTLAAKTAANARSAGLPLLLFVLLLSLWLEGMRSLLPFLHANRAALLPRAPFAAVRLLVLLCLPLRAVLWARVGAVGPYMGEK